MDVAGKMFSLPASNDLRLLRFADGEELEDIVF
jgi:hypothetical protein